MNTTVVEGYNPLTEEIVETFFYHDVPRLYTVRIEGELFLVNCVAGDDLTETYLYTMLPPHLYEELSTRPLRDVVLDGADLQAWATQYRVEGEGESAQQFISSRPITRVEIGEDWLPVAGVLLHGRD